MAIIRVQGNARGTTSSNTIALSLSNTPTNGNILIICAGILGGITVSSITQTGVTWSGSGTGKQASCFNPSPYNVDSEIWLGIIGSGASTDITVTLSGTTSSGVADVCEYSGVLTSSFLDKTGSLYGQSTSPSTGTTATTTQANELWIGSICTGVQSLSSPTNGFTLMDGAGGLNAVLGMLEKIVTATGTASTSCTSIIANWSGCIATFKASADTETVARIKSYRSMVGVGL